MAKELVTVVVPTDPDTGDIDLAKPVLFYSEEGRYIGSRALAPAERMRMGGQRTVRMALSSAV